MLYGTNGINNYHLFLYQEDEDDMFLLSDSQINEAFDAVMSTVKGRREEVVAPIRFEENVALQVLNQRPTRVRFPSRVCRSPYLNNDVRAGRRSFMEYMQSTKKM